MGGVRPVNGIDLLPEKSGLGRALKCAISSLAADALISPVILLAARLSVGQRRRQPTRCGHPTSPNAGRAGTLT